MNIQGKIKVVMSEQVISDKFKKREFVVTTNDTYPQDILIQLTQDKCSLLDGFKAGDGVDVSINLRGKEYTGKDGVVRYFNSIEAWKIVSCDTVLESAMKPNSMDDLEF